MIATTTSTKGLAKELGTTSKSFIDFCTNLKNGNITLKEGQTYLQAYREQLNTTRFSLKNIGASIKNFFGTLGANALNIFGGMVIGAIISSGIQLINKGIEKYNKKVDKIANLNKKLENLNETFETNKQKIEDINTSLEDNKKRIEEIQNLDNITYVDKQEIENLKEINRQLESQKKILKDSQDQVGKDYVQTLIEKDDLDFTTNKGKEGKAKKWKPTDLATLGYERWYRIEKARSEDTDYIKLKDAIDDLEKINSYSSTAKDKYNKYINSKGLGYINDIHLDDEKAKKDLEIIKARYTEVSKLIQDINKNYPEQMSSKEVQDLLNEQLSYLKYIDFDSWADQNITRILNKDSFKDIGKALKAKIEEGLSDEDILQAFNSNGITEGLEEEYQKISDWGLDDYAEQIKNGTIQTVFGNVDMDKRTIINWSDELKQTYADALASWDYDPEVGSIDTVFGGSERFGEDLNGNGWEVAFTPILPDGTFLSKDTVEEYINQILAEAYADDGKVTDDELKELDAQGRQIGDTFVQGIYAGVDDSQNYDNNGNWADVVGRLMHFSGKDGAIQLLKKQFGEDLTEQDLLSSDEAKKLLKGIAQTLYDDQSEESIKKAASYIVKLFRDETSQAFQNFEYSPSDIFKLKDADNNSTKLGQLSDQLDNIQSAYTSLMDTIDQYNETGYITVDQYQAILSNGSQFLDYLIDEDGNLKTDTESMKELTKARLLAMEAQMQQGLIDNVTGINTEADAMTYLSSTNYELAESYNEVSEAALEAWKVQALNNGISQDTIDKVLNKRKSDSKKISDLTQKTILGVDTNPDSTLKSSSSNSGSSKSNSKDSIDIIDFAEEKLNHLNTLIDDTQKHIEQLEGSGNKNALVDSLVDINKSKMNTLEQVSDLYTRMTDEYLAKIPEQYKGLAKEGGLEIDKFIGDGNSKVADAIKDYQTWADKVDDINSQLIELKQTLKDLEVDKFNNIKDDFDSMYSILDKNKSKIKDVVSLLETQGQNVGQGFYEELITETKSQIQILKEERDTLTSQMTSALRNGIEYGSNEWKDMYDALQDVDSSIISCENDLKDFQKSINELHWNTLEKIKDQFSSISSELDSLNSLLEKDTVTSNGKFTSESITRIGLLAQKYELARNEVAQYNKEIKYLENLYKNGKISINEYTDKLNELRDSQFSSISTAEEAKKAILDLAEARVNEAIDAIDEETDAYEELINKQKDSLQAEKDLYEYKKNIAQKEKEISALKRKINAMMGSDDASTIAEREKLEAELAEAVNDLEDYKYDHSVEVRSDALDKELEDYKDAQDKRTEALKDSLKNEEEVLNKAISEAKSRANEISNTLLTLERKQGITIASCIITPWRTGSSAIAGYNQALNSSTSNFTAKLNGIKTNIQSVQTQANNMASTIMSAFNISNNSGVYEAISKVRQNLYNTSVESIHLKQWISSALNSTYGNGAVNSINNVKDAANKANIILYIK